MINGKFTVPPDLSTVLEFHRVDSSAQLRVSIPGEIETYDAEKRTATIKVCYNRVYPDGTVKTITCPLVDVPMFTLQGGGLHMSLPITPGDECWVFFSDINLDAWHATGGAQTPMDFRRHDIADGFAFVGPNSMGNPLETALEATEGGLASAETKVAIDAATELVTIANGSQNLATILQDLIAGIQGLESVPVAGGPLIDTTGKVASSVAALAALLY